MEKQKQLSTKILQRAKKIYELAKAKDIIKWYDNQKIQWLERKINKAKQKRNKRIEREIMVASTIAWNKFKKYESSLKTKPTNTVIIQTKDGHKFIVDENDDILNEEI